MIVQIKKCIKKVIRLFSKTKPIYIPVLHGNLLNDRVALITGGAGGIGYQIAKSYVNNGCSVIIVGRNENKLKQSILDLKKNNKNNVKIEYEILDIADFDNLKARTEEIVEKYKIDILVNNAGIDKGNTIDGFKETLETNIEGTFLISEYVSEMWIKKHIKGNILNISSSSALRPANSSYAISKWGIRGMTLGLAKKYIQYGIVINAIAPGLTAAGMININTSNGIDNIHSPSNRYVTPEEIANLSVIMTSDLARMVVGDTLYVTGGAGLITYDDIKY